MKGYSVALPYITLKSKLRHAELYRGLYSKVARDLTVHRATVSAVARGKKRSQRIEKALLRAIARIERKRSANKAA